MEMPGVNLLEGLEDERLNFIQKKWRNFEKKYGLKEVRDYFSAFISDKRNPSKTDKRYSFSAGLFDYERTLKGIKISIWENNEKASLLFDLRKKTIYKISGDEYIKLMPFSSVKYAKFSYKPCLIQSIKVRFRIDFMLVSYRDNISVSLSTAESCYDDDRRSYEDQLEPFLKTCKTIAGACGWSFRKNCSTTF